MAAQDQGPIQTFKWLFPPGFVTDVYYIHLKHLPYRLDGDKFKEHIGKAWERDAPLDKICVFKKLDMAWVQVVGHAMFSKLIGATDN
ncbi:hypothetical protein CDD83_11056 [Cordyceps sp. RAO-2017]|nr:hypothetical protein CDD83_11056 [Cordyceps sp. RAO-2017]